MIYIFDKTQAIIKVLTNDDFTGAHLNFKINTATTFEFSLPASKALPSDSKYVATPHPLDDSKFIMLRLTERVDNTETIDYSAYELAYQELATDGYIEDKRPQNQSALNLMKIALDGSNWELNNVNVSGTATTNFYYVDRLSAISKVVELLGGEIVFYIEIQGNAISGRYMDYLARQGADTSKVFASGSNLLTVERQSDTSNIYTAILPRGKGEEIDNGDADTPDGYGRRINIADVEWKKSAGKPLDKPNGSIVLSDPDATSEWGQINGNARLLLQTYDDIDDVNVLINSAYKTLQSVNHPQIQYSATVADVGGLSLGDTVLIMHSDRNLSYKTRVFEVKYDLLSPDQTELSLGDDLSSNSITSQINSLNAVADTTSSQTQWTINQIGRPGTTYGATAPDSPKVGDIWFKYLPDGGTEIYRWNGDIWELLASPTTADDIATAVDDAVSQAKAHTDEVKQVLSSDIETARSEAVSQANTAEANAKSEATSLFNQAQNALSDAKTELTNGIASEASARNQAVAAANSQAQEYVNQAKSDINDTINAISVGGRNLLLGTANDYVLNPVTDGSWKENYNYWTTYNSLTPGIKYTLSSEVTLSSGKSISVKVFDSSIQQELLADNDFLADGTRQHLTFTAPDNSTALLMYAGQSGTTLGITATFHHTKLEKGTIPTDWTPAPEDVVLDYTTKDNKIKETITQYQDTNDGLVSKAQTDATTALGLVETKVSLTVYNQQTGELSSHINDVKDTADSSAQTIADIQEADGRRDSRMSEIENTASGITSTVSDISTAQGEQSGYISTLQQRADGFDATVTKVNNLSVGGRNILLNSRSLSWYVDNNVATTSTKVSYDSITNMWHITSPKGGSGSTGIYFGQDGNVSSLITKGQQWAFSFDIKGTGVYSAVGIEASSPFNNISGNVPTDWTRVSSTGTATGTNPIIIYFNSIDVALDVYIKLPKLESGNIPTDWTPAPEDVDSATAKAQLTAYNASLAVTKLTNADGVITKAQADIKANADAITQKVSKTVYDQNTGDLTQAISKAQSTADGAVSTVGNYQTSNDERVRAAESAISQNADAIALRVTTTDFDQKTGDLQEKYSQIKTNVDSVTTTVGDIKNKIDWQTMENFNDLDYMNTQGHYFFKSGATDNSMLDPWFYMTVDVSEGRITQKQWKDNDVSNSYSRVFYESKWSDWHKDNTNTEYESAISQVKVTADSISNFVRDSSGNISVNFQTALSKTSLISDSTFATSIQKQTATQITSALTDNNGKIISLINQDTSGVQIAGKNIVLDGNTTVTGDFYAKGGNFKNLNASNMTVGTLNGTQVNITNINANNITTGKLNALFLTGSTAYLNSVNTGTIVNTVDDQLQISAKNMYYSNTNTAQLTLFSSNADLGDLDKGSVKYLDNSKPYGKQEGLRFKGKSIQAITPDGGEPNLYLMPYDGGEVRVTLRGINWQSYADLRAKTVIAGNIILNSMHAIMSVDAGKMYITDKNGTTVDLGVRSLTQSSLVSLKENIRNVETDHALAEVLKSDIRQYNFKTDDKQAVHISPMIDDVDGKLYIPNDWVSSDGDSVDTYNIIGYLIQAVKELNKKIEQLESEGK